MTCLLLVTVKSSVDAACSVHHIQFSWVVDGEWEGDLRERILHVSVESEPRGYSLGTFVARIFPFVIHRVCHHTLLIAPHLLLKFVFFLLLLV